ncbi:suppressor of fused domain protein [Gorillibacterium timonense]|uniref:suppressor of fused domain protein n=1 Tax=Gorillibacterium timonense TaxID=1689269 RepID=UPI00071C8664|nr:suppressor of fused domain protein [Gorillibacterium timonense]
MPNPTEYSPSGQPIYRYESREEQEWTPPAYGQEGWSEKIEEHFQKHIGPIESVFHEVISDTIHIDVHFIKPTAERDYQVLFTTGMSYLPMSTPEGLEEHDYAELMICLPSSWPLSQEAIQDENHYWPIRWLKMLARLPHEYHSWLGPGHTVPNGDPADPFASQTKLSGVMLMPPTIADPEFSTLKMDSGETVRFYSVLPLYTEEMNYKLRHGAEALIDKLEKTAFTEVVDIDRKNAVKSSLLSFWKRR